MVWLWNIILFFLKTMERNPLQKEKERKGQTKEGTHSQHPSPKHIINQLIPPNFLVILGA
jgi:hypothetical protein